MESDLSEQDIYKVVAGRVQFDPKPGQAGGKQIRKIALKVVGGDSTLVNVTLWPEYADLEINRGDFVMIDGKFSTRVGLNQQGEETTFYDLTISDIAVIPAAPKKEREVSNRQPARAGGGVPF